MYPPYEPRGQYFDDLKVGDAWMSMGRTISEADIVNFAGVSGDFNPLHTDETYAAINVYGGRIAHGMCALSIVTGLFERSGVVEGTIVGFVGLDMKFRQPVRAGDTLRLAFRVTRLLAGNGGEAGVVMFHGDGLNQRDEVVMDGTLTALVKRRPPDEAA